METLRESPFGKAIADGEFSIDAFEIGEHFPRGAGCRPQPHGAMAAAYDPPAGARRPYRQLASSASADEKSAYLVLCGWLTINGTTGIVAAAPAARWLPICFPQEKRPAANTLGVSSNFL